MVGGGGREGEREHARARAREREITSGWRGISRRETERDTSRDV
jgi:hypothetical protein